MDIESQNTPLCNKVSHTLLKEDTILVANGTTDPIWAKEDQYKYAHTNDTAVDAFNTIVPQMTMTTTKKEKRICLFLAGWLTSAKFSLKSILNERFLF